MLNRVVLGWQNDPRDPELRRTANGTPVASFTLAMNRNFSSQNGETPGRFYSMCCMDKAAENTAKYCFKRLIGWSGWTVTVQKLSEPGRAQSKCDRK